MDWRAHITCHGKPRIAGTRVPVSTVLDRMADGLTPEEILQADPSLALEAIRAVMAYAAEIVRASADFSDLPPTLELDEGNDPNAGNYRAFLRDLGHLLEARAGGFVAYHEGRQIAIGDRERDVYQAARGRVPKGLLMIQKIEPTGAVEPALLRSPLAADRPALPVDLHVERENAHG